MKPKAPDYKGDGIAIWINEKKEKQQCVEEEML
jgi:hypothetical protein